MVESERAVTTRGGSIDVFGYEESAVRKSTFKGPEQGIPRVGVCYSALFSTPEEVRAVAEEACAGIGAPRLAEQDMRLACPVLTPVRATFHCVPAE